MNPQERRYGVKESTIKPYPLRSEGLVGLPGTTICGPGNVEIKGFSSQTKDPYVTRENDSPQSDQSTNYF